MKQFDISTITKTKRQCVFLSPHFDDAALSCGEMMRRLAVTNDVSVLNIFTNAADTPKTLSMKKMLRDSNEITGVELYKKRSIEDKKALHSIGVKQINLGYVEAMWRRIPSISLVRQLFGRILPELLYVYPSYKYHIASGRVSDLDSDFIHKISDSIKKRVPKNAVVFSPYGIGGHVDHLVVKQSAELTGIPLYYYLDQPYIFRSAVDDETIVSRYHPAYVRINAEKKNALLHTYQTQITSLFATESIPMLPEYIVTQ